MREQPVVLVPERPDLWRLVPGQRFERPQAHLLRAVMRG
jgi:hypothetical protein